MTDSLRYETAINDLRIDNPEIRKKLDAALIEFERSTKRSQGAVAYVLDQLYVRRESGIDEPMLGMSLPMRELDFAPGHPVYSITPRLLLKVPDRWREGSDRKPIQQQEEGPPQNKPIVGWEGTPLPEESVIIYPNQEGKEKDVGKRPVVQWSGVCPGDIAIIGRIDMTQREKIASIVTDVIGEPPAGKSIWEHYEESATIEDLSEILTGLRKAGFSNQYSTDEEYRKSAKPALIPPLEEAEEDAAVNAGEKVGKTGEEKNPSFNPVIDRIAASSGLFRRDKDREWCTMVFVRGDVRFGREMQEEMTDGGYATLLMAVSTPEGNQFRPVSIPFARENYRYELTHQPVDPPERSQLRFIRGHELRTHEAAFEHFLDKMLEINQSIRQAHQQEEAPDPDNVALQDGVRGVDSLREHERG